MDRFQNNHWAVETKNINVNLREPQDSASNEGDKFCKKGCQLHLKEVYIQIDDRYLLAALIL